MAQPWRSWKKGLSESPPLARRYEKHFGLFVLRAAFPGTSDSEGYLPRAVYPFPFTADWQFRLLWMGTLTGKRPRGHTFDYR
jgi:hypothetical protein